MSNATLQLIVLTVVFATILLNVVMVWQFNSKLSIQPRAVLKAIDERLEVTPKQVMERLDRIEKAHMQFVQEHREVEKAANK